MKPHPRVLKEKLKHTPKTSALFCAILSRSVSEALHAA